MDEKPTKTSKTRRSYKRRYDQLMDQFTKLTGQDSDEAFVDWIIGRKQDGDFSRNTWWQYRSAIIYGLEYYFPPDVASPLIERLTDENSAGLRGKIKDYKSKSVGKQARNRLHRALSGHVNSKTAHRIETFVDASVVTGLRPVEWGNAHIKKSDGRHILIVGNAKHTNGRSHGETREIELLTPEAVTLVSENIDCFGEYMTENGHDQHPEIESEQIGELYSNTLRMALSRAYRKLEKKEENATGKKTFQKRIALYSGRHQFKNNARKAGVDITEITYLMGHASVATHGYHYGRARSKGGGLAVRRPPETPMPQVILDSAAKIAAKKTIADKSKPRSTSKPG